MDHLWTPWRFHYVSSARDSDECIFCVLLRQSPEADRQNLILARRKQCFVVLNRFPYTTGHLMIVTHRHVPSLQAAHRSELREIIEEARHCEEALGKVYRPDGFNIGFNVGKSAGAGVAGHLHLHVVPRWVGDANFVSVVGQTRVIPEELETTYDRLTGYFS